MKLHLDKDAFKTLVSKIAKKYKIREDVLEKDYYVTLLLEELAGKQKTIPVYFKGGTALYKALKSIRRFSEDIDLTLCCDGYNTNSQKTKFLKMVSQKYSS